MACLPSTWSTSKQHTLRWLRLEQFVPCFRGISLSKYLFTFFTLRCRHLHCLSIPPFSRTIPHILYWWTSNRHGLSFLYLNIFLITKLNNYASQSMHGCKIDRHWCSSSPSPWPYSPSPWPKVTDTLILVCILLPRHPIRNSLTTRIKRQLKRWASHESR